MIELNDTICAPINTLSEEVDKYLLIRGISKKKYFAKYMVIAGKVWEEIFQRTLWVTKSVWLPLKKGEPYNYIDKPKDCVRYFTVGDTNKCGNIVPLYYNPQLNVIPKPTVKKCSCTCDCSGLCEDLNSTVMTTKEAFTINGITYYEKTWIKLCPNGDIIEYREVPTKKFNDFIGNSGDYNVDYNNDYDIAENAFANFEIVTQILQRKICAIEIKPCGCPEETQSNEDTLLEHCGCFFPLFGRRRKKHCEQFVSNINDNHRGSVKESECGTKIFFKPSRHWKSVGDKQFPDYLLFVYQTNGKTPNQETNVPNYAEAVMWAGIDYWSKRFNNAYTQNDKMMAKYAYEDEQSRVILFLNPIDLHFVNQVQDQENRW